MSTAATVVTALTFVWLGMVVAISFLEAPLKFRAPGVTLPIGLGIGRLVFRALNAAELVWAVAILVAVAMFRASGAMDLLVRPLGIVTTPLGLPPEALPMALLRSLSGSGAYGVMASILQDPAIGPDSYVGYLVSTIQGSSETTFYVLAVYFGAVQVRRIRHALAAGLIADAAGVAGSVAICLYLFGPGV